MRESRKASSPCGGRDRGGWKGYKIDNQTRSAPENRMEFDWIRFGHNHHAGQLHGRGNGARAPGASTVPIIEDIWSGSPSLLCSARIDLGDAIRRDLGDKLQTTTSLGEDVDL